MEDSLFRRSRWFTRGWTLQELLAPDHVVFYDSSWSLLGKKTAGVNEEAFVNVLAEVTGIPSMYLRSSRRSIKEARIAQRMIWAAGRRTTRIEDIAYSLLGIFSVNMTMLYGEGNRAFTRLQEEIMKSSSDESIFAWGTFQKADEFDRSLLASSPADFEGYGNLVPYIPKGIRSSHYVLTNQGLHIEMSIFESGSTAIGRLNCSPSEARFSKCVAVPLVRSLDDDNFFNIARELPLVLVSSDLFSESSRAHVDLRLEREEEREIFHCGLEIRCWGFGQVVEYDELNQMITEFYPSAWRGILIDGYAQKVKPELNWEKILLRAIRPGGLADFAVQLDCNYQEGTYGLNLIDIQYRVALIGKDLALAEVLMSESQKGAEMMLDWQESLDFKDAELIFDLDKEGGENRRWVLDIKITEKQGPSGCVS